MEVLELLFQELAEVDQNLIKFHTSISVDNPSDYRGCKQALKLEVEIDGNLSEIIVGFPEHFPNDLPKFFDKDNQFGFIPHKEKDGFICFTRNESLVIDERYPASILLNCLEKVIRVIEQGVHNENEEDFIKEFEVYWDRQDSSMDLFAHIDTSNPNIRSLDLWQFQSGDELIFIAGEKNSKLHYPVKQIFHVDINNGKSHRCIYIPLKKGTYLKPPEYDKGWDFNTFKNNIMTNLTDENKKKLMRLIKKTSHLSSQVESIIIGIPLPDKTIVLFGYTMINSAMNFRKNRKRKKMPRLHVHPFVQKPMDLKLVPTVIRRWHPSHLLNRTGGNPGLINKHVVVVGAGSIGSEIAIRLAKSGVEKLSIIDFDIMSLDNIHRHALGSDNVFFHFKNGMGNIPKVYAIKEEINRKYPFTHVEVLNKNIINVFENGDIEWEKIDLVYVAIGSPNLEMRINQTMHRMPALFPVIYTWVEPLGIGGHALVTRNEHLEGCYQCLFRPVEDEPLINISAFAEPFQEFSKTITGCGSAFTPYSFLDSERTAIIAVDVGIRVMMGIESDNPLLSWKGDGPAFFDQGFIPTPRYSLTTDALYASRLQYKNPKCAVCTPKEGQL